MNEKKYYEQNDVVEFEFIKVPKYIFKSEKFKSLSSSAKVLYILLMERLGLSIKNRWIDHSGKLFVYYTVKDVMRDFSCGTEKAIRMFSELDTKTGLGLIERKRMGFGRPNVIYFIKPSQSDEGASSDNVSEKTISQNHMYDEQESIGGENRNSVTLENRNPIHTETENQDFGKTEPNKININNNKLNYTEYELNQPQTDSDEEGGDTEKKDIENSVKNNILYDELAEKIPVTRLDEIVSVIVNTICSDKPFIKMGNETIARETVKKRFLNLEKEHIEYVYDFFCKAETPIRNIRSYLVTLLYRSDETLSLWMDKREMYCS
ncbi:MAG: replication initiator protein A [Clostridia bacterium]|nr:replication initiator protein A [Clostridia bacterium]